MGFTIPHLKLPELGTWLDTCAKPWGVGCKVCNQSMLGIFANYEVTKPSQRRTWEVSETIIELVAVPAKVAGPATVAWAASAQQIQAEKVAVSAPVNIGSVLQRIF